MRLGAILTPSDGSDPNHIANNARALEAAGFESIWSPHANGRGFFMADPLLALSVVASVTEKVELGTAIYQLPLYNPTDVAIKALTLQQLSGGRFIFGVGVGSTEADFAIHGLPYQARFRSFESCLSQLRAAFADGSAGAGNIRPWAATAGGPPIYFGTWGRNVARAANEFDGWIASGMKRTPEECAEAFAGYRAAGGGRAIVSTIQVPEGSDLGELKARLQIFAGAGFDDAVVMIHPGGPSPDAVRQLV